MAGEIEAAMRSLLFIISFSIAVVPGLCQDFIPVWPAGKKPNDNGKKVNDSLYNERIWQVKTPGLYAFTVPGSENTGTAVLICPGGGYERVSHIYNGFNFAKWFNAIGVNAFVLIYRLPHQADLENRQLAGLQDAQRAIRTIRQRAAQWNINPTRIGVMGISAGGHLASMLGTRAMDVSSVGDSADAYLFKPDFMILLSPVVTMGEYAHKGSRKNFLGADTSAQTRQDYSAERQVTALTPPAFIVHAMNDSSVKVQNSFLLASAMLEKKVNVSLHIFPQGGHGIRLDENPGSTDLWTPLLEAWLKEMKFLVPVPFK